MCDDHWGYHGINIHFKECNRVRCTTEEYAQEICFFFKDQLWLDVFYMIQVKEIRERMFNSAGFKLTSTDLKDYIKTMTTLLRDPTLLRTNDGAMQAVVKLQQVHFIEFFCNKNN